jgi:hypothetical protein
MHSPRVLSRRQAVALLGGATVTIAACGTSGPVGSTGGPVAKRTIHGPCRATAPAHTTAAHATATEGLHLESKSPTPSV